MNKKLLTVAIAASMAAPAAMAGDVTIYGEAHVAMSYYDVGEDAPFSGHGDKIWDLASHESYIGFKGSEDLGGGLSAIWQMEIQMELADGGSTGSGVLDNQDWGNMRNSFVGLSGSWGTFLMGRHDTPYNISTASLDIFSETVADYNLNGSDANPYGSGTWTLGLRFQDIRADSAVAYISPNMNGLTLAGAWVTAGGPDHLAPFPGVSVDLSDLIEAYSLAAIYSNGPFFASIAYEAVDDETADLLSFLASFGSGVQVAEEKWRVGLGYTANGFHVGFVYEDVDGWNTGGIFPWADSEAGDAERWQLSGSYTFGNNVVKAMYGSEDRKDATANGDRNQWAIGIDHNFSKRTTAYLVYTAYDADGASVFGGPELDWDAYSLGLRHKF
jgi:predicted porin